MRDEDAAQVDCVNIQSNDETLSERERCAPQTQSELKVRDGEGKKEEILTLVNGLPN